MNERERILDLVKKGVLSPEEALDLLEEIAKEKDETQIKKAAEKVSEEKRAQEDEDIKENKDYLSIMEENIATLDKALN